MRYLPNRVQFVGACEWNPMHHDPELERWLADARASNTPVLYLQLGTTFRFPNSWSIVAEVLGKQAMRVVAAVGRMTYAPNTIPANFFVRNHVSQEQVLTGTPRR